MGATFEDVRRIALGLPETTEVETWGDEATFRVRNKIFVIAQSGETHASLKATTMAQADLVDRDPDIFAPAAYVGRFGWVDIDLATVDAAELESLIRESWRLIAPKRLAATLGDERR